MAMETHHKKNPYDVDCHGMDRRDIAYLHICIPRLSRKKVMFSCSYNKNSNPGGGRRKRGVIWVKMMKENGTSSIKNHVRAPPHCVRAPPQFLIPFTQPILLFSLEALGSEKTVVQQFFYSPGSSCLCSAQIFTSFDMQTHVYLLFLLPPWLAQPSSSLLPAFSIQPIPITFFLPFFSTT